MPSRRLLATLLFLGLWLEVPSPLKAQETHLIPCRESPAFHERVKKARLHNSNPDLAKRQDEVFAHALCGADGLPRLIVDGLLHPSDFVIPGLCLFGVGFVVWMRRARP